MRLATRASAALMVLALLLVCLVVAVPAALQAAPQTAHSPHINGLSAAGRLALQNGGFSFLSRVKVNPEKWTGFSGLPQATQENLRKIYASPQMAPLTPNVMANNTAGDATGETQSECAVTGDKDGHVLVAWNDSKGFTSPNTLSSYAYSCDYGATFTDGGNVPVITSGDLPYGDCTLANDLHGNFYLSQIYEVASGSLFDCAVHKGSFGVGCPTSFTWGTPKIVATADANSSLDKPYMACDPSSANGYVYVTYSRFTATTTIIEGVASANGSSTWGSAVPIRTGGANGPYPSGSRPIVGPNGDVHVVWQDNGAGGDVFCDQSGAVDDSMMYAKSTDHGASYSIPTKVADIVSANNLGSGVGNQRDGLNSFPDLAVDRSAGPNSGNLYCIWSESGTWDAPSGSGTVAEGNSTNNNTPGGSTVALVALGQNATGSLSASSDVDYWKLSLTAGTSITIRLDPQGFTCGSTNTARSFRLRLYANPLNPATSPPETLLASSAFIGFADQIVYDVKATGTYYFSVASISGGTRTGTYTARVRQITYTSPNAVTPARDQRDIVMCRSTNGGATWGSKVLVNSDAPAGYDEELPYICASDCGDVYAFWFDRRETETLPRTSVEGQWTDIYMGKSSNGGVSFSPGQRISDESSFFNNNLRAIPNMGDYNCAYSVGTNVMTAWTDERKSHAATSGSDAYYDRFSSGCSITAIEVSNVAAEVGRGYVDVRWTAFMDGAAAFQVFRATSPSGPFTAVGDAVTAYGQGSLTFRDSSVRPGTAYFYKVGYKDNSDWKYSGMAQVVTPKAVFALHSIRPNPTRGPATLDYEISRGGDARLDIFNLAGARVRTLFSRNVEVGPGTVQWDGRSQDGGQLPAGAYFARLTSGGEALTQRVMLLR